MNQYLPMLKKTRLFAGVGEEEIGSMLNCLQARLRRCKKGEYVCRQGEYLDTIMLMAQGSLHLQCDDYWGNRSILQVITPGETFGEAYASPGSGALLHDVVAAEDSTVLVFDVRRILTVCSSACRFHTMVVQNLFFSTADKNRKLMQKLGHMARRSTREKLISYLSEEARRQNSSSFTITFNRQQLADFLSVDRSAMSNELSKLRDDGLISFDKSRFELHGSKF